MSTFKTTILYGFVIALTGSILMLTLIGLQLLGPKAMAADRDMIGGTILFLMIYLLLLCGIYFVLKKKKEENGGQLSFKTALIQGTVMSLSTAICSVGFTYLFYEILHPEYTNQLIAAIEEKMLMNKVAPDIIATKLVEKRAYYTASIQSSYSFIGNLITGLAFTFLLGFFLKTKN